MTDLQINIALARAMGYTKVSRKKSLVHGEFKEGVNGRVWFCHYGNYYALVYTDPVIFVAICKRWALIVRHDAVYCFRPTSYAIRADTIEKAAALCVIDAVKRGVK